MTHDGQRANPSYLCVWFFQRGRVNPALNKVAYRHRRQGRCRKEAFLKRFLKILKKFMRFKSHIWALQHAAKHLKRFSFIDVLKKIILFKRDSSKALQAGSNFLPIEMWNSVTSECQLQFALGPSFSYVAGGRDDLLLLMRSAIVGSAGVIISTCGRSLPQTNWRACVAVRTSDIGPTPKPS